MIAAGIKGYDHNGLIDLMHTFNQPSYRVKQLEHWLYAKGVASYSEMTDLPVTLRTILVNNIPLPSPTVLSKQTSADGTRKYLLRLSDGATVECVGIPDGLRLTVCFSTQSGCGMGCTFCATGRQGLTRSLAPGEIVDQLNLVARDFDMRVSNAVAMGQGEPFANYNALLGALRLINDPKILGIGARHITVSTCGLINGIERFAGEPEQFTLAVSLHSAVQQTRDDLMPALANHPLPDLKCALRYYVEKTGRRPTLELALIHGINDSTAQFDALLGFCDGLHCHINIIPLNPVDTAIRLKPSTEPTIRHFASALKHYGIEASIRNSRGSDINGACGQLASRMS